MRTSSPTEEVQVAQYAVPADDRPEFVDWEAGTVHGGTLPIVTTWWVPAHVQHGGRDATVVISSKGEMAIFHGRDQVGTAAAPYSPHEPTGEDFWPITDHPSAALVETRGDPAAISHLLRDTGWMACVVDDQLGLASSIPPDGDAAMLWRLGLAYTMLGFYPPLGLGFNGDQAEFKRGVDTIGERDARRVKRALIDRLNHDRRTMRDLADKIEANWRP
jgi:hypothetical protein